MHTAPYNFTILFASCKGWTIDVTDKFFQPLFVDCPDLFKQNDRIFYDPVIFRADLDMRRQFRFIHFRGDGRTYDRRAVPVPYIVLDHKHRPDAALF